MPRVRPLLDRITITLDGDPIEAERGEPIAAALLAAGKDVIARSPKFHRPRGPACMRGACDGCLARVDENPNVMTCLVPAEEGTAIVSQNRLGPREADLLRMTDWFFPDGMNHHELFAGVPGIQTVMQKFARRVAGLGKLPAEATAPRKAARRTADVVVVGAGPAGMAVAAELARAGRRVELLDDQLELGGGLTALAAEDARSFVTIRTRLDDVRASIRLRPQTTAGALYGSDLLVVGPEGAEIIEARALVLACGAHDGALAFEGNDLPNVMSARAAGWLLERGVLVGRKCVIVVPEGGGPFGASFHRRTPTAELVFGVPLAVLGTSRAKAVRVATAEGERTIDADAVLIDAPRSPSYELCEQAGARIRHEAAGFVVETSGGHIRDGIWATGEVCGVPFSAEALVAHAAQVTRAILAR